MKDGVGGSSRIGFVPRKSDCSGVTVSRGSSRLGFTLPCFLGFVDVYGSRAAAKIGVTSDKVSEKVSPDKIQSYAGQSMCEQKIQADNNSASKRKTEQNNGGVSKNGRRRGEKKADAKLVT